ncbi:hypothetical protein AU467_25935 [Mesorhizobium loti]|uniref:Glutaredoxin n=1 Tax=Rhizobium loti TaxID=381 RepID=A0A117N3B2_RHILI|nr:hypothetical protein AU467_25935 [Mesorhizobium loti]
MPGIDVLILTQDNCGFCDDAKNLFNQLAREFPMSVTMMDINSPEGQERAIAGGVLFPPGIFIGGEPFSYGRPSERKVRKEIEKRISSFHTAKA